MVCVSASIVGRAVCNTSCWFVAFATHLDRTRALSGMLLVSAGARPVHARRNLRRGAPSGRDTDLFHRQGGRFGPAHDGRGDRRVRAGVICGGSRCGFCVHGSNASTAVEIRAPWLPKSKGDSFFFLAILMWLPWLHLRHSMDASVKTESTHRVSISMWLRCQAYSTTLDAYTSQSTPQNATFLCPRTVFSRMVRFAGRAQAKGVRLLCGRDAQSREVQGAGARRERRRVRVQLPHAGERHARRLFALPNNRVGRKMRGIAVSVQIHVWCVVFARLADVEIRPCDAWKLDTSARLGGNVIVAPTICTVWSGVGLASANQIFSGRCGGNACIISRPPTSTVRWRPASRRWRPWTARTRRCFAQFTRASPAPWPLRPLPLPLPMALRLKSCACEP